MCAKPFFSTWGDEHIKCRNCVRLPSARELPSCTMTAASTIAVDLLEAQVSRADVVFFPVDRVSHNAVATVKRVALYKGEPYVALRSSGLTSLAAALRRISVQQQLGSEQTARPRIEIVKRS